MRSLSGFACRLLLLLCLIGSSLRASCLVHFRDIEIGKAAALRTGVAVDIQYPGGAAIPAYFIGREGAGADARLVFVEKESDRLHYFPAGPETILMEGGEPSPRGPAMVDGADAAIKSEKQAGKTCAGHGNSHCIQLLHAAGYPVISDPSKLDWAFTAQLTKLTYDTAPDVNTPQLLTLAGIPFQRVDSTTPHFQPALQDHLAARGHAILYYPREWKPHDWPTTEFRDGKVANPPLDVRGYWAPAAANNRDHHAVVLAGTLPDGRIIVYDSNHSRPIFWRPDELARAAANPGSRAFLVKPPGDGGPSVPAAGKPDVMTAGKITYDGVLTQSGERPKTGQRLRIRFRARDEAEAEEIEGIVLENGFRRLRIWDFKTKQERTIVYGAGYSETVTVESVSFGAGDRWTLRYSEKTIGLFQGAKIDGQAVLIEYRASRDAGSASWLHGTVREREIDGIRVWEVKDGEGKTHFFDPQHGDILSVLTGGPAPDPLLRALHPAEPVEHLDEARIAHALFRNLPAKDRPLPRVLAVGNSLNIPGAQQRVLDLLNDLKKDGIKVRVVYHGFSGVERTPFQAIESAQTTFPDGMGTPDLKLEPDGRAFDLRYPLSIEIDPEALKNRPSVVEAFRKRLAGK